jgi:desulfoferrodoxin (superoxide reductase-like protein)
MSELLKRAVSKERRVMDGYILDLMTPEEEIAWKEASEQERVDARNAPAQVEPEAKPVVKKARKPRAKKAGREVQEMLENTILDLVYRKENK